MAFIEELWRSHTQASPNKQDVVLNHQGMPGHWMKRDSIGGSRRQCPIKPGTEDEIVCPSETVHFLRCSEDETYQKAMDSITGDDRKKWFLDSGTPVIKSTFFKACRPWYVHPESLRSCGCKYHNKFKYCMEDMLGSFLWREAHASCGTHHDTEQGASEEDDIIDLTRGVARQWSPGLHVSCGPQGRSCSGGRRWLQ